MDLTMSKTNQDLKQKYDEVFKKGSENFFTSNGFEESLGIIQMLNDWGNLEVLDIGCGPGKLASMISAAGASKVDGIDYSKEAITLAKKQFNIKNVNYSCMDYKSVNEKYDVVTLQGVLEHLNNPFEELHEIFEHCVKPNGVLITSSPSFLNPRGYVWMTLQLLFDVPMSLTDLHFICPPDFVEFCDKNNYELEYRSVYQKWGSGEDMIKDFNRRLRNALQDANMDNSNVDRLLKWLAKGIKYVPYSNDTGAGVVYKIKKKR